MERITNTNRFQGLNVKEGVIQDLTFITSDLCHKKADEPRRPAAKTRRSDDGEWTVKKTKKTYLGYKLHSKMDIVQ